ncbi:hypothetical protein PG994_002215 [Apiospora phragmitis]|uniref:D-isomer specific 2-hydroxyacid dehydrogenase NAD-binding domain-containing protein n=1 Tax=Apiospora phragmitis TaxID=2905665 RepID=A0ABR1WVR6_9PEZI
MMSRSGPRVMRTGVKLPNSIPPALRIRNAIPRRNLATSSGPPPKLAILDDYLGTSAAHFSHIPPSKLEITTFHDAIVPLDEAEHSRLVERLRPFDLISTHTWALLLALARNVAVDDTALKASGDGRGGLIHGSSSNFLPWQSGLATSLTGLQLGVVGLGRLGAAVARIAHLAWDMRVICWSENLTQAKADQAAVECGSSPDAGPGGSKTFRAVDKAELFRSADVVSIHYVLSSRSRGVVTAWDLKRMKPSALLTCSKGGGIRGAAMDVFDVEPLPRNSPWRRADYWGQDGRSNVLTTPHMGYVDSGLMNAWYAETAENVERWLNREELLHRLA